MNTIFFDSLKVWVYCIIFLVLVWLGVWIANGVIWLAGLLPDFSGAILKLSSESASWWWRALAYSTLGLLWLYPCVYVLVINTMGNAGPDPIYRKEWIVIAILTALICMIYDPRLGAILPASVFEFFSSTCNAYLVTDFPPTNPTECIIRFSISSYLCPVGSVAVSRTTTATTAIIENQSYNGHISDSQMLLTSTPFQ